jgi:hypothetical protein
MADDLKQTHEVKYWADKFGVTQDELRNAIKAAGPVVRAVRERLGANRSY